jgi:hypothetical protein
MVWPNPRTAYAVSRFETHKVLLSDTARQPVQPAGIFQPRASAISLQVGQIGYFFGLRPGTQIFPQSALTAVPLTIPSTTEGPAEM